MPANPFEFTNRQMTRAKELAEGALAAPADQLIGLKALAHDMIQEADGYLAADAAVKGAERLAAKEGGESETARTKLAAAYDELAPVAAAKAGFAGAAASSHSTNDDLFASAEDLEDVFEAHAGQPWAEGALAAFAPAVDAASKEYAESVAAQRALQKAQAARASAADQARVTLLPFRNVVRATYGRSSKEYRDLKDRQYRRKAAPTPAT